ncbi:MAG: hypothetical protein FD143_2339 [Ignavibacteria bacterium]|nr:MAG: hypothetical protein FD143_2339 [Ignavibacteria bacterium]KAF0159004.1 MAG: hypothetical protein FD188_2347 [Ignavibacteria bacterium]
MENDKIKLGDKDILFTIGAFIKPMKVVSNNVEQWRWVVTSLEDQTFLDGNEIEVFDYADKLEDLVL